jgi:hypothetical protein
VSWRWVVDEGVAPAADALERLHEARALMPGVVLVASRVVLPDGSLDPASAPLPRILDKADAIEAARVGLLAVRAVRPGSMLVDVGRPAGRALAEAHGPAAILAASAALLAGDRGVLAPLSVAERRAPAQPESVADRLRLLRAAHWTREERLMQLFALAGGAPHRANRAGR